MSSARSELPLRAVLAWLGLALLALGPYALLYGPFWDGWPVAELHARGDTVLIWDWFAPNGRPLGALWVYGPMSLFGSDRAPVLVSLGALLLGGIAVMDALWLSDRLRLPQVLAVASLTVLTPAGMMFVAASATQFAVGHALWASGLACAVRGARAAVDARGLPTVLGWHGLGVLLAALAGLHGEALVAMSVALPVLAALSVMPPDAQGPHAGHTGLAATARAMVTALLRRHDAAVWPAWLAVPAAIAAFVAMFVLYPAWGSHTEGRALSINPLRWLLAGGSVLVTALIAALPALLVALAATVMARRQRGAGSPARAATSPPSSYVADTPLLFAGAVLVLAGLAPYALATRLARPWDWTIRMAEFVALGLALMLCALAVSRQRRVALALAASALLPWLLLWPLWVINQVQQDGVAQALAQRADVRRATLIRLDDQGWAVFGPRRDHEWTAPLQRATGRRLELAVLAGTPDAGGGAAPSVWADRLRALMGRRLVQGFWGQTDEQRLDLLNEYLQLAPRGIWRLQCPLQVTVAEPTAGELAAAVSLYLRGLAGPRADYRRAAAAWANPRLSVQALPGPCQAK